MSDYPLLALGSYETYQLAHIATFVAERIARHRAAPAGRPGRGERVDAVRDLAGAATALGNATGTTIAGRDLPRPLDRDTFQAARELLTTGPRRADVVALAGTGRPGFAVLGHVPGIGAVGAHAPTAQIAEALRTHLLTRPVGEIAVWAVTPHAHPVPTLPRRVDLAAFVEHLDPAGSDDRAVARNLRGQDRRTDAAIRGRFAGVDLNAAPLVTPPSDRGPRPGGDPVPARSGRRSSTVRRSVRRSPGQTSSARDRRGRATEWSEARLRLRQPGAPAAAPKAPTTKAGP
ncbi:MAG: hypothetical protein NTW05_03605 [Pseudonocardiales bacterium]|nr:hypothetical protein [Pseudonocardiales bacterium]